MTPLQNTTSHRNLNNQIANKILPRHLIDNTKIDCKFQVEIKAIRSLFCKKSKVEIKSKMTIKTMLKFLKTITMINSCFPTTLTKKPAKIVANKITEVVPRRVNRNF